MKYQKVQESFVSIENKNDLKLSKTKNGNKTK